MKRTILLSLLCAVWGAIADIAPTNVTPVVSAPTNFVTKAVRNPFWPIGYTGEWTRISSEVRPKPKPKVETKKVENDAQIAAQKAA